MKPGMDDTTPYSHAKCTACNEENTKTVPDMPMWTVNIKDLEVIMMTEQKTKTKSWERLRKTPIPQKTSKKINPWQGLPICFSSCR
jgi:hypothetical protein